MRVVLVAAPMDNLGSTWTPPIGLLSMAAVLEAIGSEVVIVDAVLEGWGPDRTARRVLELDPDVVGISAATINRFAAIQLVNLLGEAPGVFVVAGGAHFSLTGVDALAQVPGLDAVVTGEGEYTLRDMMKILQTGESPAGLAGTVCRGPAGSPPVIGPARPPITDLEALPRPAYNLVDLARYESVLESDPDREPAIGVISSRGCPHACAYCASPAIWHRRLRRRDPVSFVDEIQYLVKTYGFSRFAFLDDTILVAPEHLYSICDEIRRRRLSIKWHARSRINETDAQALSAMRAAGCVDLAFGVESGSERVLAAIGKKVSLAKVRWVVSTAIEMGFSVKVFFIRSLPAETTDDFVATHNLIKELEGLGKRVRSVWGVCQVFPGTKVEELARNQGLLPDGFSWNAPYHNPRGELYANLGSVPLYESPHLPLEQLYALQSQLLGNPLWKKIWWSLPLIFRPSRLVKRLRLGLTTLRNRRF